MIVCVVGPMDAHNSQTVHVAGPMDAHDNETEGSKIVHSTGMSRLDLRQTCFFQRLRKRRLAEIEIMKCCVCQHPVDKIFPFLR